MSDRLFNATFRNGDDPHLNACVGNNGWQDLGTYGEGFDEAVKILAASIINDTYYLDVVVHPIVFCARHRIELFLKHALILIGAIRSELAVKEARLVKTHDLTSLWNLYKTTVQICDRRLEVSTRSMEDIVRDFAEIDPTAETFRYPYSQDNVKHLIKTPIINIPVLLDRYSIASKAMEVQVELLEYLCKEYETGTFTKKLSRHDISKIADEIPNKTLWGSKEFLETRESLKQTLSIGSLPFSEALEIIKSHREFSVKIGVEISIETISPQRFTEFLYLDKDLNQSRSVEIGISAEAISERNKAIKIIADSFSREELATISSLIEIGRPGYFSETYDYLYSLEIRLSTSELAEGLRRKNKIELLSRALTKMGQPTLIECLKQFQ